MVRTDKEHKVISTMQRAKMGYGSTRRSSGEWRVVSEKVSQKMLQIKTEWRSQVKKKGVEYSRKMKPSVQSHQNMKHPEFLRELDYVGRAHNSSPYVEGRKGMPEGSWKLFWGLLTLPKDCKMCEENVYWGHSGSCGDEKKGSSLYFPPLFKSPSLTC